MPSVCICDFTTSLACFAIPYEAAHLAGLLSVTTTRYRSDGESHKLPGQVGKAKQIVLKRQRKVLNIRIDQRSMRNEEQRRK